ARDERDRADAGKPHEPALVKMADVFDRRSGYYKRGNSLLHRQATSELRGMQQDLVAKLKAKESADAAELRKQVAEDKRFIKRMEKEIVQALTSGEMNLEEAKKLRGQVVEQRKYKKKFKRQPTSDAALDPVLRGMAPLSPSAERSWATGREAAKSERMG